MSRGQPTPRRVTVTMPLSFATGMLAGLIFWALHAPSPAPPWLALTGLLGIVIGEHAVSRIATRRRTPRKTPAHPIDPDRT
jgi:XapX domain-containing protein